MVLMSHTPRHAATLELSDNLATGLRARVDRAKVECPMVLQEASAFNRVPAYPFVLSLRR